MQDFAHFPFSVKDNIALGVTENSEPDAAVAEAAAFVGIDMLISGLPRGWATPLTPELAGGVDLSGGQWQRVARARAALRCRQAELLVFDEPTAALDPVSEDAVIQRLRALAAGRMSLVITHRLSFARTADKIVVLAGGRVVEMGSHRDLIEQQGIYYDMFRRQERLYVR
ncbi:MAG: ABC transporter ATP-binding protein [Chloroflexi bacterium]|nr:ABC transporter ATP-binding protein [Chloroflexota bacterium]